MSDLAVPPGFERFVGADGVVQRVRIAAYAWCERDGAVLLVRVAQPALDRGRWTVPGGGLHFAEDPRDAVAREVAEESGLEVMPGALLGVRSAVIEPTDTESGHRIHTVGILYRGMVRAGSLRDEADGSTDLARWVALADVEAVELTGVGRWAVAVSRGA